METNDRIQKIIFALLGFTMAIGEWMNIYFSYASLLFTYVGTILILMVFLKIAYTHKIRLYGIEFKLFLLLLVSVFGVTTLHALIENTDNRSVLEFYKVSIFILLGCCFGSCIQDKDYLIDVFFIGFIIGSLVMIPFGHFGIYDNTIRFMGTYSNPNTYAVDCFICIFSSLYLMNKKKYKIIWAMFGVLFVLQLLRTGTRGALVGVLLAFALWLVFTKNFNLKITIISVAILIGVTIILILPNDNSGVLVRLFDNSYKNNERLEIWRIYLKNISKYFWFGITDTGTKAIYYKTPHNSILGILVRYGVITFVIFFMLTIRMLIKCIQKLKNVSVDNGSKLIFCMYIASFIAGLFSENMTFRATYIIITIVIYKIEHSDNNYECTEKGGNLYEKKDMLSAKNASKKIFI